MVKSLHIIFFFFLVFISSSLDAQKNSEDSIQLTKEKKQSLRSPKKAVIWALVLPGAGQIYNKKWWKLPIVYGGLGGLGYWTVYNQIQYSGYNKDYLALTDADPNTTNTFAPQFNAAQLKIQRANALNDFETSIALLASFYALTVIDAFVDAHLQKFDISNDLSLKIKPGFQPIPIATQTIVYSYIGFQFQFNQNKEQFRITNPLF
jgi:hypothetical protein